MLLRLFWYDRRFLSSTSVTAGQTPAFHAPDQQIDAVLAEERFVLEHEGRHAPMARCGMGLLIAGDDPLVSIGVGGDGGVQRGQIEARRGRGPGQMVALVPARDAAVPQHAADGMGERQRAAFGLRGGP